MNPQSSTQNNNVLRCDAPASVQGPSADENEAKKWLDLLKIGTATKNESRKWYLFFRPSPLGFRQVDQHPSELTATIGSWYNAHGASMTQQWCLRKDRLHSPGWWSQCRKRDTKQGKKQKQKKPTNQTTNKTHKAQTRHCEQGQLSRRKVMAYASQQMAYASQQSHQ